MRESTHASVSGVRSLHTTSPVQKTRTEGSSVRP